MKLLQMLIMSNGYLLKGKKQIHPQGYPYCQPL